MKQSITKSKKYLELSSKIGSFTTVGDSVRLVAQTELRERLGLPPMVIINSPDQALDDLETIVNLHDKKI